MKMLLKLILKDLLAIPAHIARDIADSITTVIRYYPNSLFRRTDLRCLFGYWLINPYAICQRYLANFSESEVQKIYGETFFTTFELIANALKLNENDVIYDLGCGRGRGVFWLNAFYRCKAIGVELNPVFVRKALKIKHKLKIENVEFLQANMMDADFSDATVLYLYGTALTDAAIAKFIANLKRVKQGTKIVTVSYPLHHYAKAGEFEMMEQFQGQFLWGDTTIYIQRKL
jgi:precorrin-6B methylase 2